MNPKICVVFERLGKEVHIFATETSLLGVCWDGEMMEKRYSHVDDLFTLSINGLKKLSEAFYLEILTFRGEETYGKSPE